jgi:hypothetical protein
MTRLSRLIMGVALVAGLATTARAAEPDKLLPAETDTIAVVNLRQIIDSDLIKKYALAQIKQFLDGQDAKQLLGDLGLDPLKDIDKIVIGSVETQYKKDAQPKFLIIVHGKFDPQKLYKTAEANAKAGGDKFAMIKDGETVMFRFEPGNNQPSVYATVVNEKIVIAASEKKLVTDALKAADANRPAPIKKELAALLAKLDDKASVTVAGLLKGKLDDLKLPGGGGLPIKLDGLEKAIPGIETMAATVRIGGDIALDISLGMKDENAAGDMRNALDDLFRDLRGLLALAGDNPQVKTIGDVLNGIKVTSKNKDVTLTMKVTSEHIGRIVGPKD